MISRSVLFIIAALIFFSSCGFQREKARKYHDQMLRCAQDVIDHSLELTDGIQSYQTELALSSIANFDSLVQWKLKEVVKMGNFNKDSSFAIASQKLLGFYSRVLRQNISPMVSSIGKTNFSEKQKIEADSLLNAMVMDENLYWADFDKAEKDFIKKYKLESNN